MRVADLNWMQLASCLARDDRAVLPVGSTEQHAYLSLCTDDLLAERVAAAAAAVSFRSARRALPAVPFLDGPE
ncbi:MAG: creatininase family protein [Candidatus Eisenbacteria bacterium]